ncbi:MAG: hypothetical protein SFW36_06130 [Leptolyngbyaceae cyanobacterium bins.59]|nr:hypothetical protein [Leptolyngbyaceae cyanobacterium bins.59]
MMTKLIISGPIFSGIVALLCSAVTLPLVTWGLGNRAIACLPSSPKVSPARPVAVSRPRPATQTVKDQRTQQNLLLKLYDKAGIPFTTYVPPAGLAAQEVRTPQGLEVRFRDTTGEGKVAYVQVMFPAQKISTGQLFRDALNNQGMFKDQQWKIVGPQKTPLTWAKARFEFEKPFTAQQNTMGTLYVGEHRGKGFYVIVTYPADYGDGFAPRANLIPKYFELR